MKYKILIFFIPVLLLLTGCSNKYQVSELSINYDFYLIPYIKGVFKNNSSHTCKWAHIELEVISGGVTLDTSAAVYNIEPGQIKEISSSCRKCSSFKDTPNIKIKVKSIDCR